MLPQPLFEPPRRAFEVAEKPGVGFVDTGRARPFRERVDRAPEEPPRTAAVDAGQGGARRRGGKPGPHPGRQRRRHRHRRAGRRVLGGVERGPAGGQAQRLAALQDLPTVPIREQAQHGQHAADGLGRPERRRALGRHVRRRPRRSRGEARALAVGARLEVRQGHVAVIRRVGPARLRVIERPEPDLLDRRRRQRRGHENQRRTAHLVRPAALLDAARHRNHHRAGAIPQRDDHLARLEVGRLRDGVVDGGPAGTAGEQRYPARAALEGVAVVLPAEAAPRQQQAGREHVEQVEVIGDQTAPFGDRAERARRRRRAPLEIRSRHGGAPGASVPRAPTGQDAQQAGLLRSGHPGCLPTPGPSAGERQRRPAGSHRFGCSLHAA